MDTIIDTNATPRKLASIQIIDTVSPIDGADRIEVSTMKNLGWFCVTKKGEAKSGDKVVYFEVDSILPEKPEFEFLREGKFRIKIRKFKKQVSEGLIIPIPEDMKNLDVGTDVTEQMGVKKHDPQAQEEEVDVVPTHRSPVVQFLMKFKLARIIYFAFNTVDKGEWPSFAASKTDEERIQTCAKILMGNYDKTWYITEKLDGQSGTFFTHYKRVWGIKRKVFGVCSRNIWLKTKHNCNYWKIAEKYDLERKLLALPGTYTVQGEQCGPGIQKNKYNLTELELFVFNVFKDGVMLNPNEMKQFCDYMGLKSVPILTENFCPRNNIPNVADVVDENGVLTVKGVVNYLVNMSEGNSILLPRKREGIVIRLVDNPRVSFKVINPQFLLESGE